MDILINDLPQNTTSQLYEFRVVDLSWGNAEGNKCTKKQVTAVKTKGWAPFSLEHGEWQEYEGIDDIVTVKSITLNMTSLSLQTGQSETLTATVKPDNATDKSVTWTSSNTSVVSVDSNGKVTAVATGSATITCTANDGSGVKAYCDVTVTMPKPESISLPETATVAAGQTITLTPEIMPADAETTLTWKSRNEAIATVDDNGIVTGIKEGSTFITVETDNGLNTYCKLTVTKPALEINADVNGDGSINVADISAIIDVMAGGNSFAATADVNGDGSVNVADIAFVITRMAELARLQQTIAPKE